MQKHPSKFIMELCMWVTTCGVRTMVTSTRTNKFGLLWIATNRAWGWCHFTGSVTAL